MRTGLRVRNAFAGSPQYPSPLRYGAMQQSHSRFARTMGCLSFHQSIRIWSTIFCSGITSRKAISGYSRIFGFSRVRPTYNCPPLITTRGRLSLGPTSPFVYRLRVRLVCGLALLRLTVPLPRLDCPTSRLWSRSVVGPLAVASAWFVFPPGAPPLPRLPRMLPKRPPRPLNWVGIWSMKEFCNLNYDDRNVFEEFFHWPDTSIENWGLVHPVQTWIVSLSTIGYLFVKRRFPWIATTGIGRLWYPYFSMCYICRHRIPRQFLLIRGC
jgi:hypothetical protein